MKFFCIMILTVVLSGCGTKQNVDEDTSMYQDGTYQAMADGYGGEFEVKVVIKDDKIENIYVNEHNETPSIGGVAIEQMIAKMKEKNSYQVDMITGATRTSVAMSEAVKSAIEQAK